MKNKLKLKFSQLKTYYKAHPKRFWALGIVLVLIIIGIVTHKSPTTTTIVPVTRTDLKQTILATGQVTSATDLNLSFSSGGQVRRLPVAVGDKVWAGEVLAELDNGSEYAALSAAKARYAKVVDGTSNEDVAVAQVALTNAQTSLANIQRAQDTLVASAHSKYLNTDLTPTLTSGTGTVPPTITGTYEGTAEGSYLITTYRTGSGSRFNVSGLDNGDGDVSSVSPAPLGTKGLFITFPTNFNAGDTWTLFLPNTKSTSYLTDYNAYQNALKTRDSAVAAAQAAVDEAQANLNLKKAPARSADIAVAQADIDQAAATYEKTVLRAPASGTVVHVDTKIGEHVDAQKEVVVIQDVGNLYVEANINETNIAKVSVGQPVVMTLDAFGPDVSFTGKVIHIDPSSTTNDGVVNYVIKTSIDNGSSQKIDDNRPSLQAAIRPGMNANMTITAWDHPNVIAVPKAAVKTATVNNNAVLIVQVVKDEKKKKYEQRVVTTGDLGDGNLIEITSGLSEGEKIAVGADATK